MIPDMGEIIKGVRAFWARNASDIFIIVSCLLVALTASGGYRAYKENPPHPAIEYTEHAFQMPENSVKAFMASKAGETYYPEGCKAGSTIKDTNKIYFATGQDAEKAGFAASKRCK
jgi:hypothetical protein